MREHLVRIIICLRFSKERKISGEERDFWHENNFNNNRLHFIENKCVDIKVKEEDKNKLQKPHSIFLWHVHFISHFPPYILLSFPLIVNL